METNVVLSNNLLSRLKNRRVLLRVFSICLSVLFLNLATGCKYYRVKTLPNQEAKDFTSRIDEFNASEKYIIVHQNSASLHLQNASVDASGMMLLGTPRLLDPEHVFDHYPEPEKSYRYKSKQDQQPLNEIHFYISDDVDLFLDQEARIPLQSIEKIAESKADAFLGIMGWVGSIAGVLMIISLIVALTKSSCPFLYVETKDGFVFQGELYPGSILEKAQKPDFMKLPLIEEGDGFYSLNVTNELREIQHTDEVVLEIVDHPDSVSVFMDPAGEVHTITAPLPPSNGIADGYRDITATILAKDELRARFDTPMTDSDGTRKIDLSFDKPQQTEQGKLVLSVRNTLWLDYSMGLFLEKFGSLYPEFQRSQQKTTSEEAYKWREDQSLPISVFVLTTQGWELMHHLNAVGPMAFRDIVLPLDLKDVSAGPLQVRLQSGFHFWEIDKIAMDFSEDLDLFKREIIAESATDDNGREVRDLIAKRDGEYHTQGSVGDQLKIQYASPERTGEARTVFVRSTGYYTYIRDYSGIPDIAELKKFRNPGHFTKFSESQYNSLMKKCMLLEQELISSNYGN